MSISTNKITNKRPSNPIDIVIYEKGLRIKTLFILKDLDLLLVILNIGKVIKSKISIFRLLKDATQKELEQWTLRQKGVGIRWEKLDEDLSLKGFIKDASIQSALQNLRNSAHTETELV
jgi:hypothetical protein